MPNLLYLQPCTHWANQQLLPPSACNCFQSGSCLIPDVEIFLLEIAFFRVLYPRCRSRRSAQIDAPLYTYPLSLSFYLRLFYAQRTAFRVSACSVRAKRRGVLRNQMTLRTEARTKEKKSTCAPCLIRGRRCFNMRRHGCHVLSATRKWQVYRYVAQPLMVENKGSMNAHLSRDLQEYCSRCCRHFNVLILRREN